MLRIAGAVALAAGLAAVATVEEPAADQRPKPTIVLVHGAFTDTSVWNEVVARLTGNGFRAIAAANPLRSVSGDAASLAAIVRSVPGEVVLVGHSYGGAVITEAANGIPNVKALVYVAGFAPDAGESSLGLSAMFEGGTLGDALTAVPMPDGGQELFIQRDRYHAQFAGDLPGWQAMLMASAQRPVTLAALSEPSGAPAWRTIRAYMIHGSEDRNIPAAAMSFMAERAGASLIEVGGASHALMISHPDRVVAIIERAAMAE
ncbi:MAG: alpha/beta hydrolase [Bauldia sp.]|nr:alpha/beta hydrolase [Bauldia sp.]